MILRTTHTIGCRITLYILGFWHIPTTYQRLSRRHPLPKIYPPGLNIASGDLIICNKLSYVEVLYLGYRFVLKQTRNDLKLMFFRFAPTFTAVSIDGDAVKSINLFTALFDSMNLRKVYKKDSTFEPLQDILYRCGSSYGGPVVLFPEVRTSTILFYVHTNWIIQRESMEMGKDCCKCVLLSRMLTLIN